MTGMPSLFANLPSISMFPTPEAARLGAERAKYGKEPFTVTSYNVKVFDMSKEEDRTQQLLAPVCGVVRVQAQRDLAHLQGGAGETRRPVGFHGFYGQPERL